MTLAKMRESFPDGKDNTEVLFDGAPALKSYLHYLAEYLVLAHCPETAVIGCIVDANGEFAVSVDGEIARGE
jgi:hypothetical protein